MQRSHAAHRPGVDGLLATDAAAEPQGLDGVGAPGALAAEVFGPDAVPDEDGLDRPIVQHGAASELDVVPRTRHQNMAAHGCGLPAAPASRRSLVAFGLVLHVRVIHVHIPATCLCRVFLRRDMTVPGFGDFS